VIDGTDVAGPVPVHGAGVTAGSTASSIVPRVPRRCAPGTARPPRRRARPRRRRRDRQPWWFDSLEVGAGQSYFAALRTDNPGVWLDHCHNLQHACDGRWTT
jgi:Putative multicopper oxidases